MNVSQAITARTAGTGVGGAGVATNTMSDATAYAIKCSKAQFIEDMRRLLEEAQRYLGDVSWRVDDDGEVIYGHRGELLRTSDLPCAHKLA